MGYQYDLHINRECADCIYGEYDLLEQKYYCTLREGFREPEESEACPDIRTGQ